MMIVAERTIEAPASSSAVYVGAHSLRENAFLSLISAFMTFVAGTLVGFIQGHFLPLEVFGRISYAATFSGLLALIPNYGFELLVVREVAQGHYSPGQMLANVLVAKTLLLLPVLVITQTFIWLNHTSSEEASLIWVYLASFFVLALSRAFCSVNKGRDNFRVEAAVYSVQAGTMLLGALFAVLVLRATTSMPQARITLVGRWAGLFVGAALTSQLWSKGVRYVPEWRVIKNLLRVGFPFALQAVLATAYVQIDTLFVRNLLGIHETAYYQAAMRIIVGINMLATFLGNAFYPRVARSFKDGLATAHLDHSLKMMRVLAFVGLLISLSLFVTAKPLLYLIYGPKMAPSIPVLQIAAFIALVRFVSGGYGIVLMSIRRQEVPVIGAAVAMGLISILDWLVVPRAGLVAAAWINLLVNIVVLAISLAVIIKELHSTLIKFSLVELGNDARILWATSAQLIRRLSLPSRGGG